MNEETNHKIEVLEKQKQWHLDEITDDKRIIEHHKVNMRDIERQIADLRKKAV